MAEVQEILDIDGVLIHTDSFKKCVDCLGEMIAGYSNASIDG